MQAILIQGDSVRMTWGLDERVEQAPKPIRRDGKPRVVPVPAPPNEALLCTRLGEELDYVRRLLDALGDQLAGDPILLRRHAIALQSLDIVGQILSHLGNVIRSSDPQAAVEEIGMGDLKARLMRTSVL